MTEIERNDEGRRSDGDGALPFARIPDEAARVLHFWFVQLSPEQWFSSSDALDAYIGAQFGGLLCEASEGGCDGWADHPKSLLALVIVLDQFSRNIHRDTAAAFTQDEKAQALVMSALERGFDENLGVDERQFLYMPLMHAESRELQQLSVEKFEKLAASAKGIIGFAESHRDIVEEYGRFPYRNPMLGRESTPEERTFIAKEGNPFS